MTDAWMPGAERIPAPADGGCLKGGAPRAVWLPVHANPLVLSARAVAERLITLGWPSHLVWNPVSGDVAQLIPAVRAGRALGWPDSQGWLDGPGWLDQTGQAPDADWRRAPLSSAAEPTAPAARDGLAAINTEGRVCVQIAVLSQVWWPFTEGPAERLAEIVHWLDSWQVPRGWPAGRPARFPDTGAAADRRPHRAAWPAGPKRPGPARADGVTGPRAVILPPSRCRAARRLPRATSTWTGRAAISPGSGPPGRAARPGSRPAPGSRG